MIRTVAVDDATSRAYVANRGSNSVSVVDLTTRQLIAQVAVGNRPYGVVVSPDDDDGHRRATFPPGVPGRDGQSGVEHARHRDGGDSHHA